MAESLRSKTIRALFWSFLESMGLQGVRFVIGIVLARLLLPEQFGLIGMLMIFMAVAQSFLDSGFGAALIQKREATPVDINSIFYFNIVVGLAAAGLLCAVAPWVAARRGHRTACWSGHCGCRGLHRFVPFATPASLCGRVESGQVIIGRSVVAREHGNIESL